MNINQNRNMPWPLWIAVVLATAACGSETPLEEGEVSVSRNAIAGGVIQTGAPGLVDFTLDGRPGCTGSMIAPNMVLTAAHCFKLGLDGLVAHQTTGPFMTTVSYYDPSEGKHSVYDGPATWLSQDYHFDKDFPGDANDDFGVVIIPGAFRDTDYHDYKRLYDDVNGPIGAGIFLRAYGAGGFTWDGQDDDNLRRANFEVESVSPEHIVTDNQIQQTCLGDSGGPLIKVSSTQGQPDSLELVAGVLSLHEANTDSPGSFCADNNPYIGTTGGDNSAWCKVPNNFAWLQGTAGLTCTQLLGSSTYRYRRCFQLPFIEDVAYEGLSRATETAIAMAFL